METRGITPGSFYRNFVKMVHSDAFYMQKSLYRLSERSRKVSLGEGERAKFGGGAVAPICPPWLRACPWVRLRDMIVNTRMLCRPMHAEKEFDMQLADH